MQNHSCCTISEVTMRRVADGYKAEPISRGEYQAMCQEILAWRKDYADREKAQQAESKLPARVAELEAQIATQLRREGNLAKQAALCRAELAKSEALVAELRQKLDALCGQAPAVNVEIRTTNGAVEVRRGTTLECGSVAWSDWQTI